MKRKKEDITGVPPKGRASLFQYYTIYKSVKKNQKSFRITQQLLKTIYNKAVSVKKEGLIIITIPCDVKTNFIIECIVRKDTK
jgi:hypothetical protein